MAVGFRSFLGVDTGGPVIDAVMTQMEHWSVGKQLGVSATSPGRHVLSQNDIVSVQHLELDRGRMLYRWRRHHPFAQGAHEMLRTTVTAMEQPDRPGWLWTEVELPNDSDLDPNGTAKFMSVPSFLRTLIGELSCRDGRTPVSASPQRVTRELLPDVMDYLADEIRRGPVYVASQEERADRDLDSWAAQVTWELAGLGATFLLGSDVERAFNDMVGPAHAVMPGTVRTFQPNVDLDNPADPKRHRSLSKVRIEQSTARQLSHILGVAQRNRAARTRVPHDALLANQFLVERERRMGERVGRGPQPAVPQVTHSAPDSAPSQDAGLVPTGSESAQQHESAVLAAVQSLEGEIKTLRHSLGLGATNGRRHLNAL